MPRNIRPRGGFSAHLDWLVPGLAFVLVVAGGIAWVRGVLPRAGVGPAPGLVQRPTPPATQPPLRPDARRVDTAHYVIFSTATPEQTQRVARAVEHLHEAYVGLFPVEPAYARGLELVLYRDRREFQRSSGSRMPWAEAYYLRPRSHAYFGEGDNPYHWMLHEATHQLMRQASGFAPRRWFDEGIATYFGTSLIDDRGLQPGRIDTATYPVWWLRDHRLSGDLAKDLRSGAVIPLRAVLTNTGPDFSTAFNRYYVQYWSLVHFLMHADGGRHAQAFRRLVARGGTVDEFERLIGPVEAIERDWYAYLVALTAQARDGRLHGSSGPG
ncbi:hypothetical protein [Lysobacter humi (ex Lee et al. 2017)]